MLVICLSYAGEHLFHIFQVDRLVISFNGPCHSIRGGLVITNLQVEGDMPVIYQSVPNLKRYAKPQKDVVV